MSEVDEALRVLQAELSASPSPDFVARVRTRVASTRAAAPRRGWLVPAAAAAVLLAGVAWWMRTPRTERAPAVVVESPAPPTTRTVERAAPTPSVERIEPPRRRAAPGRVPRPTTEPVRPIVPPGEEMRIARYAASVRRWPFEADTLPEYDPREPLADPKPIAIAPLETAPLVPEEGSHR